MTEKPFYKISMKASSCFFDVQINNVSLFSMNVKGQLPITLPLNYLILESGLQDLSVKIMPNIGDTTINEEADFLLQLQLFDSENMIQCIKNVASYEIDKGKLKVGIPVLEQKIKFNAEMPYKLSAWQNSVDLKAISNVREQVQNLFQKIDLLISSKRYDEIIKLMSEREKNMAISMYLTEGESKSRMEGLIQDFKDGFNLMPLSIDDFLIYYADGKVAKIAKKDLGSAIRFFNKKTGEEMTLSFLFHIKQDNNELSII